MEYLTALGSEIRSLRGTVSSLQQENEELRNLLEQSTDTDANLSKTRTSFHSTSSSTKSEYVVPVSHEKAENRRMPMLLRLFSMEEDRLAVAEPAWRTRAAHFLELGPPAVIILNAVAIALDSDVITNETVSQVIGAVFTLLYLSEFLLKLTLLGWRGYFWDENWQWNWFDFLCLLCALLELVAVLIYVLGADAAPFLEDVAVMRVLRLGQLMRTVRVLKFKMFSELRQITMGIMNGCEVLFWAVVLLFAVIYVFGVLMRNLVGGTMAEFDNIPNSMFTLFRCFTDGCSAYDGAPLAERLRSIYGAPFTLGYVCVTMLVAVGIFNMIMAIFLENATASAQRRKQRELSEKADASEQAIRKAIVLLLDPSAAQRASVGRLSIASRLSGLVRGNSATWRTQHRCQDELFWRTQFEALRRSTSVDRKTFMQWLQLPEFLAILESADVDVSNKFDLFDVLDADMGGVLELDEVVTGLMKLRGPVSKADLVATRLQVRLLTQQMTQQMNSR
ncbi:unnamed protein product [Effrenium voratum]|uniref:Ion transport domain-containing protein n=2 Tax=Effrenium voratum TaxID=2562239 RepID=A0AA36I7Q9_9DINO|nr:unnamed protein product [Effrenium voratum]CAJ1381230.1 unnamed protein product [Effrenium voratum]CAJ1381231.1 unnamed protein product [Effrenium voratum]